MVRVLRATASRAAIHALLFVGAQAAAQAVTPDVARAQVDAMTLSALFGMVDQLVTNLGNMATRSIGAANGAGNNLSQQLTIQRNELALQAEGQINRPIRELRTDVQRLAVSLHTLVTNANQIPDA